jgi:predicted transcriptional regulator
MMRTHLILFTNGSRPTLIWTTIRTVRNGGSAWKRPGSRFSSATRNRLLVVQLGQGRPELKFVTGRSISGNLEVKSLDRRKGAAMEVQFTQDQQTKLSRMAAAQGRAAETLVQEAVDRLLRYDEWFSQEVDKGLAAADNGEFVEHGDIRRMIETRYPA